MRRRIVGLDLNGRFDMAARDWNEEDSEIQPANELRLIRGGAASPRARRGARPCRLRPR
jgi:hypothetical protein